MKLLDKLSMGVLGLLLMASCQAGLEYDEVPASTYEEVGLSSAMCTTRARELFEHKIYAVNWNKWAENYIQTLQIGGNFQNGTDWTNNSSAPVTLHDGTVVAPGETKYVKNFMTEENDSEGPDGKVYVVNLYTASTVTYNTPNKGYLFVENEFNGVSNYIGLVNPVDGRSQQVKMGVRQDDIIIEMNLSNQFDCNVYPQDGAPAMGKPGDFTKGVNRYLVENIARRTDGKPSAKRLYEIRVMFMPE